MRISSLSLESFGPFESIGPIVFGKGFNLIVGQNNAGKSAFLKSFKSALDPFSHRNGDVFRTHEVAPSQQTVELDISGVELREAMLRRGGQYFWPYRGPMQFDDVNVLLASLFGEVDYSFKMMRGPGGQLTKVGAGPSHGLFDGDADGSYVTSAQAPRLGFAGHGGVNDTMFQAVDDVWTRSVFLFDAERMKVGRGGQQEYDRLLPDASNLPAILHTMRGQRPGLFDQLVRHVRDIIPSVFFITTVPRGTSETEILIWPESDMTHAEHAFPLSDSGTGVAQVISILTAVATTEKAIIVIDEINSFLHPLATKSLIRLLQSQYPQHQYIISTHSAEVISSSAPSFVHMIRREGFKSIVQPVDIDNLADLKGMSDHLGITVTDIFAADHVLWVEGKTEEICFPVLMNAFDIGVPPGTVITSLVATGDFSDVRGASLIFQIYERLTRVTLPLVRSVTFSFDSEGLTETEKEDLRRRGGRRVEFLPRRHLECYLLDPAAIAAFVNEFDLGATEAVTEGAVADLLAGKAGERRYLAEKVWSGDLSDPAWQGSVDAANLLRTVIAEVSENRLVFRKAAHSLALMRHHIAICPRSLDGLVAYARQLVQMVVDVA